MVCEHFDLRACRRSYHPCWIAPLDKVLHVIRHLGLQFQGFVDDKESILRNRSKSREDLSRNLFSKRTKSETGSTARSSGTRQSSTRQSEAAGGTGDANENETMSIEAVMVKFCPETRELAYPRPRYWWRR